MNNAKNFYRLAAAAALLVLSGCQCLTTNTEPQPAADTQLWAVDSVQRIAGAPVAALGNPAVVASPLGQVVRFNGRNERLLVQANPLLDAEEFTIEVLFRPDDAFAISPEPRFVHIEADDNPNRRITIELRLNDRQEWYLDAYIKSEVSQFTLIDSTKVHPIGPWYHAAISYRARTFTSYVNGVQELVGEVDYLPIAAQAKTSLGARMNQIHWFKGDIAALAVTPRRLAPDHFVLLHRLTQQ